MKQNSATQTFLDRRRADSAYVRKVLIAVGIVTAVFLFLVLLWSGGLNVLLLVFAGMLLAVLLDAAAGLVGRFTGLSRNWSLTLLLITIAVFGVLGFWLLMPTLRHQTELLITELPQSAIKLRQWVGQYAIGQWVIERIPEEPQIINRQSTGILVRITGYVSVFLDIAVATLIVLATGIYFAFKPDLYRDGITMLFPPGRERRIAEVLDIIGITLRRWLAGRFMIMAVNGVITAFALWMLGMPIPLLLGLLTGVLNFIPNIGPFLAAVPAVLIALTQGMQQAIYVAVLFLLIQNLEGFVLTPLVQEKSVELPPALVLASQLLLGVLFGFLGILLAVPVVAVAYVLVRTLYVEDVLGHKLRVLGEQEARNAQDH